MDMLGARFNTLVGVGWAEPSPQSTYGRYTTMDSPTKRWAYVAAPLRHLFRREWDLMIPHQGTAEHAAFQEFLQGVWGRGPFHYVPDSAFTTNMLTPQQSLLNFTGNSASGQRAIDGVTATTRSLTSDSMRFFVPVWDGYANDLDFSIEAKGSGQIRRIYQKKNDDVLVWSLEDFTGSGANFTRHTLPLWGSDQVYRVGVDVRGFTSVTRPQVRHADAPDQGWAVGQSAEKVILQEAEWTHRTQTRGACGSAYSETAVTLVEVG